MEVLGRAVALETETEQISKQKSDFIKLYVATLGLRAIQSSSPSEWEQFGPILGLYLPWEDR